MPKKTPPKFQPIPLCTTICPNCHTLTYAAYGTTQLDGTTPILHIIDNHPISTAQAVAMYHHGQTTYQLDQQTGITYIQTPHQPLPRHIKQHARWWHQHYCGWNTIPTNTNGQPLISFDYPPYIPTLTNQEAAQLIAALNPPPF